MLSVTTTARPTRPVPRYRPGKAADEPQVSLVNDQVYRVDFGADIKPRCAYVVNHNGRWDADVPEAVYFIEKYLTEGGTQAQPCRSTYWPILPAHCPVCGAKVAADPDRNSQFRGAGWRCQSETSDPERSQAGCYWTYMGQALAAPQSKEAL